MNDKRNIPADKDHPEAKGAAKGAVVGGVAGGVAGGAAAGAAVGGMTGPAGAVLGAAVGAMVGAVAGKRKADPVAEESFWRDNYADRPYIQSGKTYDDYGPAYRYGADAYNRYPDRSYDDVEADLGRDWGTARGKSSLEWEHAKHATRDAWHRVERAIPGDADKDGR